MRYEYELSLPLLWQNSLPKQLMEGKVNAVIVMAKGWQQEFLQLVTLCLQ